VTAAPAHTLIQLVIRMAGRLAFERSISISALYSVKRNGEFTHILMVDVGWRTLRRMHQLLPPL
jgi:hypothetical protein